MPKQMTRKTVSYLNVLRKDLERVLDEIAEVGHDIESASFDLSRHPACDFNDKGKAFEDFKSLTDLHKDMAKQLKALTKARDAYIDFF